MHATKLIQLLKIFTDKELLEFPKYVKNLGHKPNPIALRLFDYLKRYAPDYDSPKLSKDKVYRQLAKKEAFAVSRWNKITHDLKLLLEDFLAHYKLANNAVLKKRLLLQTLKERNHPDFATESKKLLSELKNLKATNKSPTDYLDLFQVSHGFWSDINTEKFSADFHILATANQNLDTFYFLHKLKINLEYVTSKNIIKNEAEVLSYAEITTILNLFPQLKENSTINLFYAALQLEATSKEKEYLNLKNILFSSIEDFTKKDARDMVVILNNHYNRLLNTNQQFYANEGYELYVFADKNDLLIEHNRIREVEFANATTVGFFTGHNPWTFAFMDKYRPFLAQNIRTVAYTQAEAVHHLFSGNFNQAIALLNSIESPEKLPINTHIRTQTLKLRTHYEAWESENYPLSRKQQFVITTIEAFERFIDRRKQLAESKKEAYIRFAYFLKKATKCKPVNNHRISELKDLQLELKNNLSVALKKWLADKIDKLLKSEEVE